MGILAADDTLALPGSNDARIKTALISTESQKDQSRQSVVRRFALGTSLFYASALGVLGTYLPFFSVWLKNIGIDAQWIGIITAMPSLSRFTVLPFVTAFAERRNILRDAMIAMAFLTAVGFAAVGLLREPIPILIAFALLACVWTPLSPLTDGYALKGVATYGLNYGPMRLWGSASFIVATAALSAVVSLRLMPLDAPPVSAEQPRASGLLKQPLFWAIIGAHTLIQGSHGAYYGFASITWQSMGFSGFSIALLWSVGVIAEIVIFAISPRFTLQATTLVIIGASSAVIRWILTAMEPRIEILSIVQLMHGLSFGITQVGIYTLLVRSVPHHLLASAQGYLVAFGGIVSAITVVISGVLYARFGSGVYFAMALMAAAGGIVMLTWRTRLDAHHGVANEEGVE
jgi:PPP family 3-phenylpropionic acid transporter